MESDLDRQSSGEISIGTTTELRFPLALALLQRVFEFANKK
jgi:hypothetical protein